MHILWNDQILNNSSELIGNLIELVGNEYKFCVVHVMSNAVNHNTLTLQVGEWNFECTNGQQFGMLLAFSDERFVAFPNAADTKQKQHRYIFLAGLCHKIVLLKAK